MSKKSENIKVSVRCRPMNEKEKKQSKQHIQSLAELCINQIYENKFLNQKKEIYTNQVNLIKNILINNSKIENNDNTKKNIILREEIKNFYNSLISSNIQLQKEEKKLSDKYTSYKDNISKEDSMNKQLLTNTQYDNLLLICKLKEKEDIIKGLNKTLDYLKQNIYFKENKREIQVNNKWGDYYLNINLNNLSKKMMAECQNFIQYRNRCEKREKEKNKIQKDIDFYEGIIKYIKNYIGSGGGPDSDNELNENIHKYKNGNKKNSHNTKKMLSKTIALYNDNELSLLDNKNSLFDDNLIIDKEKKKIEEKNNIENEEEKDNKQLYSSFILDENHYENLAMHQNADINNKLKINLKKKSKSRINFLTVDELFDVNNHEGKETAIIDDELHSDDETIFEIKVKPLKKITIHYIPKIKKQVPQINLSQIEFNKQKVMNEADLYSLQRRKYKMQNLDENIKTMKKKIKKLRHTCKINKKKLDVFEKHAKNMENNYKTLKPLKIQSSLNGVKIPKIQKFLDEDDGRKDNGIINELDDIDLGDEDSDHLEEDMIYDMNNTEVNNEKKISISDKNNILIKNEYNNDNQIVNKQMNNKQKKSKKINHNNKSSNRANSK